MARSLSFNLHNILKFKINTVNHVDLLKDINFFLSYFETESVTDPDIILNIGKFTPSNQDCFVVDHKYFIKENYFYCNDQEARATWEVEIFGFETGKAIVNFDGKIRGIEQFFIPDYLAQNFVLRPLIELKLLEKGYVVIHGLGIEQNNQAIILIGRGGSHKTSLAMESLRSKCKKVRIIGDDRVIIGKDRTVFSYPIYYETFLFKLEKLSDEHVSSFFDIVRYYRYLNSNPSISEREQIFSRKSDLNKIILVVRNNSDDSSNKLQLETVIPQLINNNKMEMITSGISSALGEIHFLRYMQAYSYVYPESAISIYWNSFSDTLRKNLIDVPVYTFNFPEKYSNTLLDRIALDNDKF